MISIIIPTYNEEGQIGKTIQKIRSCTNADLNSEIIIADGGSSDNTVKEAKAKGARILICGNKGRAIQMNEGARKANYSIVYFLHADSFPPTDFVNQIHSAIQNGYDSGCFALSFDYEHWFLKTMAWFTRFKTGFFRFGDQSLFVKKENFDAIDGFEESLAIMEDQEIIWRLKRSGSFVLLSDQVTTSARKFLDNGPYRLMGIFMYLYFMYYVGVSQHTLIKHYRQMIINGKV